MEPGHVALQIIKAGAAGLAGAVQIDSRQPLHDFHMIGNVVIWDRRLAEAPTFHILAVVFPNRHRRVDDIGNDRHPLAHLSFQPTGLFFQFLQLLRHGGNLAFDLLGLFLLAFGHQTADLLAQCVALAAQIIAPGFRLAALLVQLQDLVHQRQLVLLVFFADIFPHRLRVVSQKFDVDHVSSSNFSGPGKRKKLPTHFHSMGRKLSAVPPKLQASEKRRLPLSSRCKGRAPRLLAAGSESGKAKVPRRLAPPAGSLRSFFRRFFHPGRGAFAPFFLVYPYLPWESRGCAGFFKFSWRRRGILRFKPRRAGINSRPPGCRRL